MLKFSSSGGALCKFALGLTLAAVLAACGGGGGGAPAATVVASTDSSSAISAADPATSAKIVTAVLDKTFTFPLSLISVQPPPLRWC